MKGEEWLLTMQSMEDKMIREDLPHIQKLFYFSPLNIHELNKKMWTLFSYMPFYFLKIFKFLLFAFHVFPS